jgi:hypothetical protein
MDYKIKIKRGIKRNSDNCEIWSEREIELPVDTSKEDQAGKSKEIFEECNIEVSKEIKKSFNKK